MWSSRMISRFGLPAACLATVLHAGCQQPEPVAVEPEAAVPEISAERGEYLVTVGVCNDCHTPWQMGPEGPAPDMTRLLSGHPEGMELPPPPDLEAPWGAAFALTNTAFAGPWGISYATNLTPDENTGMGIWTEQMFIDAMRKGRHMGTSRPILPPMPWPWYSKMTDEDLKSVYAYLRSIPPIQNRVPEPVPPAE